MPKKTDSVNIAPSGITGLDEMMGGGFERNGANLVRGGTGSGKTMFCLQSLFYSATMMDEPGIFISFEESKESVYRTGANIGCDLEALEKEGKFEFIKRSPHEVEKIIKEGGGTIKDVIEKTGAKRLVIDSLSAYALLFETPYMADDGILALYDMLNSWKITSLVTEEKDISIATEESGRLGFLSDSIVHLYHLRSDMARVRGLEIIKIRHSGHSNKIIPFKIEKKGINLYPDMQLLV